MKDKKYALSTDEFRAEMKALETCFGALRDLSSSQRHRVAAWLNYWFSSEERRRGEDEDLY